MGGNEWPIIGIGIGMGLDDGSLPLSLPLAQGGFSNLLVPNCQSHGVSTIPHGYSPNSVSKHSSNKTLPLLLLRPSSGYPSSSHPVWSTTVLTVDYERISERRARGRPVVRAAGESMSMTTEKLGVKVHRNPPESKLTELGVRNWPKWGCPQSKFPWTYSSKEVCYLLKGKVKVYPEGSTEAVEIGAGDLVEFPKGMSCTWDVSEAVDKHYNFE